MSFLNLHQPENDQTSSSSSLFASSLNNVEQRVFSCSYCSRKFYSPQAFGGHQNAHKIERTLAKKSRELSSAARHKPEWNHASFGLDSNSPIHVRQEQQPAVVGTPHQELSCSPERGTNADYGYKGENRVEDDFNHLDLSLRL